MGDGGPLNLSLDDADGFLTCDWADSRTSGAWNSGWVGDVDGDTEDDLLVTSYDGNSNSEGFLFYIPAYSLPPRWVVGLFLCLP
jgi:hypothetical protein